jgi:hypothetical protein
MTIMFRAVSWRNIQPEADKETAYEVLNELQKSPLFDAGTNTHFIGDVNNPEPPGTFTFQIAAKLKKPMKL